MSWTAEEMHTYQKTALRRHQAASQQVAQRRARAWELARQAAERLKTEFGVERVTVFGSLIHADRFTEWSDVDLAVWGLTDHNWLRASAAVSYGDIEINLVDVQTCRPEVLANIEREGVPL
jgi:predicted nucleotidyltransferase